MVSIEAFKQIALSFEGTEAKPHFNRTAFKVINKRIFATLLEENETANIVLSITDQEIYCSFDKSAVYPVPNKFGMRGWTTFELPKVPVELISDALLTAYNDVISKSKKSKM
ncbi:MAG: MmcQ/YjbR family DNA-binding protein [Chitinophagaceae bacterium]